MNDCEHDLIQRLLKRISARYILRQGHISVFAPEEQHVYSFVFVVVRRSVRSEMYLDQWRHGAPGGARKIQVVSI